MTAIPLDPHCHLLPGRALDGLFGAQWDASVARLRLDGHPIGMADLYDPLALITWLDAEEIERAWVSAPPPVYRPDLDAHEAAIWNEAVHQGLTSLIAPYADRLSVMRLLPIEHPALASEIVANTSTEDNLFTLSTGGPGLMISDPEWQPLWHTLSRRKATVLLHPGEGDDARLHPYYLNNLLGNPVETSIAVAHLVFSVALRHAPDITWILAHGGGATAMMAGRWRQGYATSRPGVDTSIEAPDIALRRFHVDWITHSPEALALADQVFGSEQVVFGSDWPFPMGTLAPQQVLGQLPSQQQTRLRANTIRLLGS